MITSRHLRHTRRRVMRPVYPLSDTLSEAAKQYDTDGAGAYGTIQNPTTELIYRYLSELVVAATEKHSGQAPERLKILDWGGGKGYATYFVSRKGVQVTLYETTEFAHTKLWKHFGLKVKTSAPGVLPFPDKSFDAVMGFGVLEHVPYDYEALKDVNRVLKDDGLFFCFNLPNKFGYVHRVSHWRGVRYHDRLYGSREVRLLLKRAGFNTIGKPWRRQLLPKNWVRYPAPRSWERIDLALTRYTPLGLFATSLEFVARKQYTYTSVH